MRKRIASTLRRWAYRIEGHRPAHRAGDSFVYAEWPTPPTTVGAPKVYAAGSGGLGGTSSFGTLLSSPPERANET